VTGSTQLLRVTKKMTTRIACRLQLSEWMKRPGGDAMDPNRKLQEEMER